jgi:fermentation-respiration switch protein FrsA (DUF1100 family)
VLRTFLSDDFDSPTPGSSKASQTLARGRRFLSSQKFLTGVSKGSALLVITRNVPTLVIHGDDDQIVPIADSAAALS